MNELSLLDNGVVPVYTTDTGEKVVNGRELWQGLQSKQHFADWIKARIEECIAQENVDFEVFQNSMKNPTGGRPTIEYIIKLATAKEMAMLERNDVGKQVRKYFISVEEKHKSAVAALDGLSPQLQLLINIEMEQKRQQAAIEVTNQRIDNMQDVMQLDKTAWRERSRKLITRIAQKWGGNEYIQDVQAEIYRLVEARAGASLTVRLTNLRRRMAEEGVAKSKRDRMNRLDVIDRDKRLLEIFLIIVKEMAVKNDISPDGLGEAS